MAAYHINIPQIIIETQTTECLRLAISVIKNTYYFETNTKRMDMFAVNMVGYMLAQFNDLSHSIVRWTLQLLVEMC